MLRPLRDEDLAMILVWRNHPAVRRNMYNTHEITMAEHLAWWARTVNDPSARYFVYEDEGDPSGVVGFTQINTANRSASWAFYAREGARRGIGTRMEVAALSLAFGELGLSKLSCEVLSHNLRVVRMHQKFGFRIEGVFRCHHQVGDLRLDVYRLAMLAKDWHRNLARQAAEIEAGGKPVSSPTVGDRFDYTLTITAERIRQFAVATGDVNPIHLDDEAARAAGFDGRIAHGVLLLGEVSRVLGTEFPGKGTIIADMKVSFLKPTYADRPIKLSLDVLGVNGRRLTLRAEAYEGAERLLDIECGVLIAPAP